MIVREATRADLDALVALQARTMGVDAWTPTQVEEELARPGGIVLVGEDGGTLVAFAFGWVVFDELQVLQVGVDPDQRQGGRGRAMLAALEAGLRRADVAFLEVRVDNEAAIRLYVGAGYRVIGRRPRYYADAADALVMRKRLGPAGGVTPVDGA
jgi:ribosomal-protein-alanine N-acetyltransferase